MKTYSEQFLRDEYERMLTDYDLNKSEFGFEDYLRNNNLGVELKEIKSGGVGMGTYLAIGGVGLALAGMVGANVLNNKLMGLQSNMYDIALGNNPMDSNNFMDTIQRQAVLDNDNSVIKSMFGTILGNVKTRINPDFIAFNNANQKYRRKLSERNQLTGGYQNPFFGMATREIGDILVRNLPAGITVKEFQSIPKIDE